VGPYQLFFAPAGQERCTLKRYMVSNKNATNDIEAAMNNHRKFVFMFGDLRDRARSLADRGSTPRLAMSPRDRSVTAHICNASWIGKAIAVVRRRDRRESCNADAD
jgi:hypothetical protein